jgi:hypothetical protein
MRGVALRTTVCSDRRKWFGGGPTAVSFRLVVFYPFPARLVVVFVVCCPDRIDSVRSVLLCRPVSLYYDFSSVSVFGSEIFGGGCVSTPRPEVVLVLFGSCVFCFLCDLVHVWFLFCEGLVVVLFPTTDFGFVW